MTSYKQKIQPIDPLADHNANDPQHRQDRLPYPYSMIVDVLNQTIMHKLNIKMHHIEQKKKDNNYEGGVQQYIGQTLMEIEGICCLSKPYKSHNHLVAGDKAGNIFLLDLAKRGIFSKKQIANGKKVIYLYDAMITDGDTSITTIAVINHGHHIITIARYRYSEPKLFITDEIHVAPDSSDPNLLPYSCQLHDFCRLISVKTYNGQILFFRIPQLTLEIQKKTKSSTIPLQEQQIKKLLKYPLQMAALEENVRKISQKVLQINFKGEKAAPNYNDVRQRLLNLKKPKVAATQQATKKDPKKKDDKKVQQIQPQKKQLQLKLNKKLVAIPQQLINGVDCAPNYPLPQYEPYLYFIQQNIAMPKSKYFEKAKLIPLLDTIVYGWKGIKQFYIAKISKPNLDQVPQFLNIAYHQEVLNQNKSRALKEYMAKKLIISGEQTFKNVHEITASAISLPDKSLIAFGLKDGTISLWNILSKNLQFNTDKHTHAVTKLAFFQKWKLVSGDENNGIFIHNVVNRCTEMKRSNIFEPTQLIPIVAIQISELGIAQCLDSNSNLRVFDLWRNEKIAKISPCNSYAMMENKGKKWLPSQRVKKCTTLYTNRDFTVLLSLNWPSVAPRVEDRTPEQVKKLNQISENPWRVPGTNTHVIRNFDFLLSLFEGLQSVYKKGYQRKKIQNLFSNLEYVQLNDRTFEIPDFSQPEVGQKSKKTNSANNKSLFSGNRFSQKSFTSSKSKQKSLKGSESSNSRNVKLTNQILHPQKFLFERRKIIKDWVVTNEGLMDLLREQHAKKEVRQAKLITQTGKSQF